MDHKQVSQVSWFMRFPDSQGILLVTQVYKNPYLVQKDNKGLPHQKSLGSWISVKFLRQDNPVLEQHFCAYPNSKQNSLLQIIVPPNYQSLIVEITMYHESCYIHQNITIICYYHMRDWQRQKYGDVIALLTTPWYHWTGQYS